MQVHAVVSCFRTNVRALQGIGTCTSCDASLGDRPSQKSGSLLLVEDCQNVSRLSDGGCRMSRIEINVFVAGEVWL